MIRLVITLILLLLPFNTLKSQETVKIDLQFPAMPVNMVKIGLFQAAYEPFIGTATYSNGKISEIKGFIPPTYVRGFGLRRTVDACVANGVMSDGKIVMQLPAEPVRLKRGVMTALAMDSIATLTLDNGTIYSGIVTYPDAPTKRLGFGRFLASSVNPTGTLTKVSK